MHGCLAPGYQGENVAPRGQCSRSPFLGIWRWTGAPEAGRGSARPYGPCFRGSSGAADRKPHAGARASARARGVEGPLDRCDHSSPSQEHAPDAFFVGAFDERDIERLAHDLRIAYEFCVSDRLSRLLPELDSYLAGAAESPRQGAMESNALTPP